eukprot:452335-Amorphochlora_amoeboformis.AAC.1
MARVCIYPIGIYQTLSSNIALVTRTARMIARTRRAPEWSAGKYPLFEEAQAGLWSDRKCRNEGEGSLASFKYYYVEAWELRSFSCDISAFE